MPNPVEPKNSAAFFVMSIIGFVVFMAATAIGLYNMPVDVWVRAFTGVSTLALVYATFTLGKVIRDKQEAGSTLSRLDEARLQKMLAEYDPIRPPSLEPNRAHNQH